jgi:hypothetical protein
LGECAVATLSLLGTRPHFCAAGVSDREMGKPN